MSAKTTETKLNKTRLTKKVNVSVNGHSISSHHLIHAEEQKNNRSNLFEFFSKSKQTEQKQKLREDKMQNQQPVSSIAPKIAKEVSLKPLGGSDNKRNGISIEHPTPPLNVRQSENDLKPHFHQFGSPSRGNCASTTSMMIPERDIGPRMPQASPPTLTQATPLHPNYKPIPQRAMMATRGNTAQSIPVKAQPALISSSLAGKVFVPTSSGLTVQNGYCSSSNVNGNINKIDITVNSSDTIDDKPKHFHAQNPTNLPAPQPTKPTTIQFLSPSSHNGPINHPPVPHQFHSQQPQMSNSNNNSGMLQHHQSIVPGIPQHLQHNNQMQHPSPQHPMKSKSSASSNVTRSHHHNSSSNSCGNSNNNQEFQVFHKQAQQDSSSDENRSSGHASMSDTGGHGSSSPGSNKTVSGPLGSVPEDSRLSAGVTSRNGRSRASTGKTRHRAVPTKNPWSGNGLEDIKTAIQQLTLRSQTSTSTYSSLSAGSESSEPARRLARYSSLETVNTNVTSADEFVWVDSHNRLVELQHPPWSQYCLMRVIRTGRCKEFSDRISAEAVPRIGYLLTRALVRISREIQRLSSILGLCSKHEVAGAFKIVLCPALADSCIKSCLRAAAMFALSGDGAFKQTKSSRAGLQLPVGRFHRWMIDARLGKLVHEYAAVYLCAGFENLLEEILLQCVPSDTTALTAMGLEHAIANSGDLWGLLQPFVHLNAGRIASGALTMPRWTSDSSVGGANSNSILVHNQHGNNNTNNVNNKQEPCLLTTCVGSLSELKDLVNRSQKRSNHITMSQAALRELFYFMRCSQLEHNEGMYYYIHIFHFSSSILLLFIIVKVEN